jgi:plastocyanin
MNLRRAAAGALALSTVIALGACTKQDNGNNTLQDAKPGTTTPSGGSPSSAPAGAPEIDAKDNEFVPKNLTVNAGDVTITMKNTGAAPHTFTLADPKVDVNVDAGKSAEIVLTGLKAGTYKFVCKYHESLGMTGELTVT